MDPSLESLPFRYSETLSGRMGYGLLALLALTFCLIVLVPQAFREMLFFYLFLPGLAVLGAVCLIPELRQAAFPGALQVSLGTDAVSCQRRGPLGMVREWEVPLSEYQGLRIQGGTGDTKNEPGGRSYAVELVHPREDRRVPVFKTSSEEAAYLFRERVCQAVNLPAVENDGAGFLRIPPSDLGAPLQELVENGHITPPPDPGAPTEQGIEAQAVGDGIAILIRKSLLMRLILRLFLLLATPASALLILLAWLSPLPMTVAYVSLGVYGGALLILLALYYLISALFSRKVRILGEFLETYLISPWGEVRMAAVRLSEIVAVTRDEDLKVVCVLAPKARLHVGTGLSRRGRDWLKTKLLFELLRHRATRFDNLLNH